MKLTNDATNAPTLPTKGGLEDVLGALLGGQPNPSATSSKPKPSTTKPKPSTTKPKPSTTKPKPSTTKPKPSTTKPKPTTSKPKPTTTKPKPTTSKPKPTASEPAESSGGLDLGSLLGGLLGSQSQPASSSGSSGSGGLDLVSLLGALLTSQAKPKPSASSSSGSGGLDLGSILQALLSARKSGAVIPIDGMAGGSQADSAVAPILDALATQVGLSSDMGEKVVAFVLSKLASSQQAATDREMNVSAMLDSLSSQTDANGGLAQELAQETGLDPETASKSLTVVLDMLGG